MDMCAGNGIISILLSSQICRRRNNRPEIQKDVSDMASRSVILNNLSKKINMVCGDLKFASDIFGKKVLSII